MQQLKKRISIRIILSPLNAFDRVRSEGKPIRGVTIGGGRSKNTFVSGGQQTNVHSKQRQPSQMLLHYSRKLDTI